MKIIILKSSFKDQNLKIIVSIAISDLNITNELKTLIGQE